MKLTIEIPDAHTGDLLQFLASIASRTVEAPVDPAPGHPELPLDEGDIRWAAADPLKVAMDDPVEPRLRPFLPKRPEGIPAPPKDFVFAGMERLEHPAKERTSDVLWLNDDEWTPGSRGWLGNTDGPWAVRIGSPIAIANGFAPF